MLGTHTMLAAASSSRRKGYEFTSEQNHSQGLDLTRHTWKTAMSFVFQLENTSYQRLFPWQQWSSSFQVYKQWIGKHLVNMLDFVLCHSAGMKLPLVTSSSFTNHSKPVFLWMIWKKHSSRMVRNQLRLWINPIKRTGDPSWLDLRAEWTQVESSFISWDAGVFISQTTVGWNPAPVEVGSLSHYLQGFIHPRWCRISSINSSTSFVRQPPQILGFASDCFFSTMLAYGICGICCYYVPSTHKRLLKNMKKKHGEEGSPHCSYHKGCKGMVTGNCLKTSWWPQMRTKGPMVICCI